jgi:hypothetical protein
VSQTEFVKFHIPLDTIEKGTDATGRAVMKVKGCLSTDQQDTDQEVLVPQGFQTDYFLSHGFINYNHQGKVNPSANIGEPTKCWLDENGQFMVEGNLYPDNSLAKSTYDTMHSLKANKSTRKMCWSIEGKVLERDPLNAKRVTRLLVTGAALTLNPKNTATYAEIAKSLDHPTVHDGDVLSTVEVYARIFEHYPTLEKGMADSILGLIEHIATPTPPTDMAQNATPTIRPEHVTAAFEMLHKSMAEDLTTATPAVGEYFDEPSAEELLEKGIDSGLEQLRQGESRSSILKSLRADGFNVSQAGETFALAAARYAEELDAEDETEDDDDEAVSKSHGYDHDQMSKGDDDDDDEPADDDEDDEDSGKPWEKKPAAKSTFGKKAGKSDKPKGKKPFPLNLKKTDDDEVEKSDLGEVMKSMAASLDGKFGNLAVLFQGLYEKIDGMSGELDERMSALEDTPMPRKSQTVSKGFQERPFAGQNLEKSMDGGTGGNVVSVSRQRDQVLDYLDRRCEKIGAYRDRNAPGAKQAMDAMMHFEQIGTIEKSLVDELQKEHGIQLVN